MLKTREHYAPAVNVFIADAGRMGCELMASARCRSKYRVAVVGYATNGEEGRAGLSEVEADVAVIAAQLKEGATAGFDLARATRKEHQNINIVMMLDLIDRATVIEAFRSGASGIFSRDGSFELLCKCVHSVHQGQIWAGSRELRFLIEMLAPRPAAANSPKSPRSLTKREQGVVHLVGEGLTNRDISKQLNLSENTVRNYMFRIFNKVGTSNRLELALYALDQRKQETVADSVA
jgi:two-component system nitrate/nitrite response regulator NarL